MCSSDLNVYGLGGDDAFFVGSILGTETVRADGQDVSVVTEITHGASYAASFYGGGGDDYFEVNHTVADISLFGDNGDDTFFIKALLTLDEADEVRQVSAGLTNVSGQTGAESDETQTANDTREVDIDSLAYVQNARINIDGGTGFNSLALVGTVLSDTFYIYTEVVAGAVVQRIYGAGVKLDSVVNVQRIQLLTGPGDDKVYVQGVDLGPVADLVINLGTGSDTVTFGGPAREASLSFPAVKATRFASTNGYDPGGVTSISAGRGIQSVKKVTRVVPYDVTTPATTRDITVPAGDALSGVKSPVLIQDPSGLLDNVVFDHSRGATNLFLDDKSLKRWQLETDGTRLVLPTAAVAAGARTDLLSQTASMSAAARSRLTGTADGFLVNQIGFTARYFDPGLVQRLKALAGSATETVSIPAGVGYASFQNTLDNAQQPVSALQQLRDFLVGTGYTVNVRETANPDPSQSTPYRDITSIADAAGRTIAWKGTYATVIRDDTTFRDLIGVTLVTAGAVPVAVRSGYVKTATVVSETAWDTVRVADQPTYVHFQGMDEIEVLLPTARANAFTLADGLYAGKTVVQGGNLADAFTILAIGGKTLLYGNAGDDTFQVGAGSVAGIGNDLFLFGGLGTDSVSVRAETDAADVNVAVDRNTVQRTFESERTNKLTNALEFKSITAMENTQIRDAMRVTALGYARLGSDVDAGYLTSIAGSARDAAIAEIDAALAGVRGTFRAAVDGLVAEQVAGVTADLLGSLSDYGNLLMERASVERQSAANAGAAAAASADTSRLDAYLRQRGVRRLELTGNPSMPYVLGSPVAAADLIANPALPVSPSLPLVWRRVLSSIRKTIDIQNAIDDTLADVTTRIVGQEEVLQGTLTAGELSAFGQLIAGGMRATDAAKRTIETAQSVGNRFTAIRSEFDTAAAPTLSQIDSVRTLLAQVKSTTTAAAMAAALPTIAPAIDTLRAFLGASLTASASETVASVDLERLGLAGDLAFTNPLAGITAAKDLLEIGRAHV